MSQVNGSSSDSEGEQGAFRDLAQTITDVLEEAVVTLIEAVRERPAVAAALVAGVIGTALGLALARTRRPKPSTRRATHRLQDLLSDLAGGVVASTLAGGSLLNRGSVRAATRAAPRPRGTLKDLTRVRSASELVPLAAKLLQNPLVRGYLRGMLSSRLPFGRRH